MATKVLSIEQDDLAELSSLYEELSGLKTEPVKMAARFQEIKADPRCILLGVKLDGHLVGSAMGILCRDLVGGCRPFMVVENVIVSQAARRKGIGKALMLALEEQAASHDCYYVMFVSAAMRREAHEFYASLGYELDVVRGFKKYMRR